MARVAGKSVFRDLGSAKVVKRGQIIVPGHYICVVKECLVGGRKDEYFIVELGILDAWDVEQDDKGPKRKAGDEMSYVVNLNYDSSMPNIKAFIMGLDWQQMELKEAFDEDDVDQEWGEDLVGEAQPAAGVILGLEAFNRPQKENPEKDFTYCNWTAIDPDDAEQLLAAGDGEAQELYEKFMAKVGK